MQHVIVVTRSGTLHRLDGERGHTLCGLAADGRLLAPSAVPARMLQQGTPCRRCAILAGDEPPTQPNAATVARQARKARRAR